MTGTISAPMVATAAGTIRGSVRDGVEVYLGIPYAAPPFGRRRFLAPQPVEGWNGIRTATAYGPTAPKGSYSPLVTKLLPEVDITGEDCLNLNVWTPGGATTGHPVLVWIHGGSFTNGSGSLAEYDGTAFARDGVVCVTINYRLGAEGFLVLDGADTNRGLLDAVAALTWVRDNISGFGGDPDRVTVAGESAGAMSVATLLAMPAARGLCARAIVQSGPEVSLRTPDQARVVTDHLSQAFGVAPTRDGFLGVAPRELGTASSELATQIRNLAGQDEWREIALQGLPFYPVVDGDTLPRLPIEAVADPVWPTVPLVVGTTADEARLFFGPGGLLLATDDAALRRAAARYGLSANGLQAYRVGRSDETPGDVLSALWSDWRFRLPSIRLAAAAARAGAAWMYRFDAVPRSANGDLGSCHATEVPFVFDTIELPSLRARLGDAPSRAAAELCHGRWVRFIISGDPGWPQYTTQDRSTAILSDRLDVVDDPRQAEREAWADQPSASQALIN